jgi:hypothetical protein
MAGKGKSRGYTYGGKGRSQMKRAEEGETGGKGRGSRESAPKPAPEPARVGLSEWDRAERARKRGIRAGDQMDARNARRKRRASIRAEEAASGERSARRTKPKAGK